MSLNRSSLLEQAFFHERQAAQLDKLRAESSKKEKAEALREASGISDDRVLAQLVELDVSPAAVSAMTLVPLVAVAWADGEMADRERKAILDGAEKEGIDAGSAAHGLLNSWLERKPGTELTDAWSAYVGELLDHLADAERRSLHETVMGRARAVAAAAGGFLGISTISAAEETVLDQLDNAFHAS